MMKNNKKFLMVFFSLLCLIALSAPFYIAQAAPTGGLVPCGNSTNAQSSSVCDYSKLIELFNNVIRFLLFDLAAPLATIAFVYAGFLYVTAAGDTGKIAKAHDIFKNVLIGIILAFGAFLIVTAILKGLDVKPNITDPILKKN